jgi:hypothetical protein
MICWWWTKPIREQVPMGTARSGFDQRAWWQSGAPNCGLLTGRVLADKAKKKHRNREARVTSSSTELLLPLPHQFLASSFTIYSKGTTAAMANNKKPANLRGDQMPYETFMARHKLAPLVLESLVPSNLTGSFTSLSPALSFQPQRPLDPLMQDLKRHPFFRILRAAARENCPDAFNGLLYIWLCRMGAVPPEGVFRQPRGKGGRPRDPRTALILEKWIELGCPPLSRRTLAFAVYGSQFAKASSAERKKMVDSCRRAVERARNQMRPNSEPI